MSVAAAVLLAGPASTWALDVAGTAGPVDSTTTQVVSTTQQVTTTTDQTASSTVSTVEPTTQSTVQSAVQTTQTAVSAPEPTAPAASAPAAPSRTSSRSTPTRVAGTPVAKVAVPTTTAGVVRSTASGVAATGVRWAATHLSAAVRTSPARRRVSARGIATRSVGQLSLPVCGNALPAEPVDISALVTLLCSATEVLNPPATRSDVQLPLGQMLTALQASVAGARAHGASLHGARQARLAHRAGPTDATARSARTQVAGIARAALAHPGVPTVPFVPRGYAVAPHALGGSAAGPAEGGHQGLFGTSITGTEVVFALLALDWAILMALVVRRASRRWRLAPRYWSGARA